MASSQANAKAEELLAMLTPSPRTELWEMGMKPNWTQLRDRLEASGLESMWIRDRESEEVFTIVQKKMDGSRDGDGRSILHRIIWKEDGDNGELMSRLLALGLHPDLPDHKGWRPSHCCPISLATAYLKCAEALSLCWPDLTARNGASRNPMEEAEDVCKKYQIYTLKRKPYEKIQELWENFMRNGFPSLAQLASDQKWYAVKNLCRRRVVDVDEVSCKYRGKDAVAWMEFHGQKELAEEVRYLYEYPTKDKSGDEMKALQEMVKTNIGCVSNLEGEIRRLCGEVATLEKKLVAKEKSVEDELHALVTILQHRRSSDSAGVGGSSFQSDCAGTDSILLAIKVVLEGIWNKALVGDKNEVLAKVSTCADELQLDLSRNSLPSE